MFRQSPVHRLHLTDPHLQLPGHLAQLLHCSDVLKEYPILYTNSSYYTQLTLLPTRTVGL